MGPVVIRPLLAELEHLEIDPLSLSVTQQVAIEAVLCHFGPQVLPDVRRAALRHHRASSLFPALIRIQRDLGVHSLRELLYVDDEVPWVLVAPLIRSVAEQIEAAPTLDGVARAPNCNACLLAALPLFSETPTLRATLREHAPDLAERLDTLALRYGIDPMPDELLADPRQTFDPLDDKALRVALEEAERRDQREPQRLLRLTHHLDDPRVRERMIWWVHTDDHPLGPLAFRELARHGVEPLEPMLRQLLRRPHLDHVDHAFVRGGVALATESCAPVLRVALRSETPRVVLRAVEWLSAWPIQQHVVSLLKALGRHRYTPLSGPLAAPLLGHWHEVHDLVRAALDDEDREVKLGAIEVLGPFGTAEDAEALLALWDPRNDLRDALLNVLELLGPQVIPALSRRLSDIDDDPDSQLLRRRLQLLQHLDGEHALASPIVP